MNMTDRTCRLSSPIDRAISNPTKPGVTHLKYIYTLGGSTSPKSPPSSSRPIAPPAATNPPRHPSPMPLLPAANPQSNRPFHVCVRHNHGIAIRAPRQPPTHPRPIRCGRGTGKMPKDTSCKRMRTSSQKKVCIYLEYILRSGFHSYDRETRAASIFH